MFDAGTITWGWGLDKQDYVDARIQQTTANLLLGSIQAQSHQLNNLTFDPEHFAAHEKTAAAHIATQRDEQEHEARRRNDALIAMRHASISASFEAKIARAQHQLITTYDERIQRIRAQYGFARAYRPAFSTFHFGACGLSAIMSIPSASMRSSASWSRFSSSARSIAEPGRLPSDSS